MHYARWSKHGDPLITAPRPVKKPCTVEGCDTLAQARGWCHTHYRRWKKHGDPLREPERPVAATCSVDGCEKTKVVRGLCPTHRRRQVAHGDPLKTLRRPPGPCKVEGCETEGDGGHGWCDMHYRRWRRHKSTAHRSRLRPACKAGHEFTPANTRIGPNGRRGCRACAVLASHRRRFRKANAPVNDLTARQWAQIKTAYGFRCAYCQKRRKLTMDHVVALSKGGSHTASNIVPACGPCNSSKGNRPAPPHQMALPLAA